MEQEIVCPSGLSGVVRALKVRDEALYSNLQLLKSGTLIQELCKLCWINTINSGPYQFDNDVVNWPRVLQGDAFWIFMQLRRISYGDEYTFKHKCDDCGKIFTHTADLGKDLKLKKLPVTSVAALQADSNLSTTLPDGRAVVFKLLRSEDDKPIATLQQSRKMLLPRASLVQRLVAIDGVAEDYFSLVNFVEDMDAGEADDLSQCMEEFDCGVDTDLTITCTHCMTDQVTALPFDPGFFRRQPKKQQK